MKAFAALTLTVLMAIAAPGAAPAGDPFQAFFGQVAQWQEKAGSPAPASCPVFAVTHAGSGKKATLSFTCRAGAKATARGAECLEAMPDSFIAFLKTKGYQVKQTRDSSAIDHYKISYKANGPHAKFNFTWTSQGKGSNAYSTITLSGR